MRGKWSAAGEICLLEFVQHLLDCRLQQSEAYTVHDAGCMLHRRSSLLLSAS